MKGCSIVRDAINTDYSCAWEKDILWQGRIYITSVAFCFYAKIFGNEIKQTIYLKDIINIEKANTAGVFSNAIRIYVQGTKPYFFASFLRRDQVYDEMIELWENCKIEKLDKSVISLETNNPSAQILKSRSPMEYSPNEARMKTEANSYLRALVLAILMPIIIFSIFLIPYSENDQVSSSQAYRNN